MLSSLVELLEEKGIITQEVRARAKIAIKCYKALENLNVNLTKHYYRLFHIGSRYLCPFCLHSYSAFVPSGLKQKVLKEKRVIGGGYRLNVICPYCGSGDRDRLVYVFTKENQLIRKQMKLLHVAPERKLLGILEKEGINLYSADLDSSLARIKMDIRKINFPDGFFDAIICNHVLEHIVDDLTAMKELFRVLESGGWAILQVPYSPILTETFEDPSVITKSERSRVFGQSDHVRIYGRDYVNRLQSVGFEVEEKEIDADSIKKFALNCDEKIFFCKKFRY